MTQPYSQRGSASWIAKLIFGLIAQWGGGALQGHDWEAELPEGRSSCFLFHLKNKCWLPHWPQSKLLLCDVLLLGAVQPVWGPLSLSGPNL